MCKLISQNICIHCICQMNKAIIIFVYALRLGDLQSKVYQISAKGLRMITYM